MSASSVSRRRFLGITVLGDFIVSEGVQAVLENVLRAGATAVACNPTVTAPAEEGAGSFQPPIDAGESPRVFDRPLFGRTSLWVRSGPSYVPNARFYKDSPYPPRQANDLTEKHGPVIGRFIDAAVDAGLEVYLQLGAAQPSGLRDEDRPRLPNGEIPRNRMADTGSLASAAIRAYNLAYVRDLFAAYPKIAGIRPDWPEYPCYTFDEIFQDFGEHVRWWAEVNTDLWLGESPGNGSKSPFEDIRRTVARFYEQLLGGKGLSVLGPHFEDLLEAGTPETMELISSLLYTIATEHLANLHPWLRIKSCLSYELLEDWHWAILEFGGPDKKLSPNAFAHNFSHITGFAWDAADFCNAISPKLYTMHWSLMIKLWGERLLAARQPAEIKLPADIRDALADHDPPRAEAVARDLRDLLSKARESVLVEHLLALMDLDDVVELAENDIWDDDHWNDDDRDDNDKDEAELKTLADFGYPRPDEPHPIPEGPQRRKIDKAIAAVRGRCAVTPLVHGYGPLDDFRRRLKIAAESPADGVWINRYGYLSDAKLEAIRDVASGRNQG